MPLTPGMRKFMEGMLEDSGMNVTDEQMREDIIQEMFDRVNAFMVAAVINKLSERDLDTFIAMNEQGRPEAEINEFIVDHIPNAREFLLRTLSEVWGHYCH